MSLSSLSMTMPSLGLWERFEYSHVIMQKCINVIEAVLSSLKNLRDQNEEIFAVAFNPNFIALTLAFISCASLAAQPEAATIEILFGYGILNAVYIISLLLLEIPLETVLEYWLLPNLSFIASCIVITAFSRLYLSKLGRFPGLKKAALSNYWMATEIGNGTFSKTIKDLHKKYDAKVIRTGPNELSVNDAEAIVKLFGEKYQRGPVYEGGKFRGHLNIKDTRSNYLHTIWRRIWDEAFDPIELKYYASLTDHAVSDLVRNLKSENGKDVNATEAIDKFAIDISSELTFGESMGMQDGQGDKTYIRSLQKYSSWFGYYGTLRNIVQMLAYFPEPAAVKDFRTRNDKLLVERQKRGGGDDDDITSHLLEEDEITRRKFQVPRQLSANTSLSMLMGAATGTTITQTLRSLAKNKSVQNKLRAEIDAYVKSGGELTAEGIKSLTYLNGVVNEALRLHNPLPLGGHATVNEKGIDMGSYKLPPYTQVYVPVLAIMTDDRYFPRGEEFIPERWTEEKSELVVDKRAFIPWGYGAHACAGKQLALNEMRQVIARIVREFDVDVGESDDEKKWEDEWKAYPIVQVGDCMLKFKSR